MARRSRTEKSSQSVAKRGVSLKLTDGCRCASRSLASCQLPLALGGDVHVVPPANQFVDDGLEELQVPEVSNGKDDTHQRSEPT